MEKIDTSPEEEAVKDEARQFMSSLVASPAEDAVTTDDNGARGGEILKTWNDAYEASSQNGEFPPMEKFWSLYDPTATSIWKMVYDESDSNENLEETIEIVASLMQHSGMESVKGQCFGVVHTLESLEIEGVWFFNGADPEKLFGANDETSWFTFSQLGPDANDLVKKAVNELMAPPVQSLNGKKVANTRIFF